jgi:hypothetical protein
MWLSENSFAQLDKALEAPRFYTVWLSSLLSLSIKPEYDANIAIRYQPLS